jgi:sortase (surface protein transpeptidase)
VTEAGRGPQGGSQPDSGREPDLPSHLTTAVSAPPDSDLAPPHAARHRGRRGAGLLRFVTKPGVLAVAIGVLIAACGTTGMVLATRGQPAPKAPPAANVPVPLGTSIQTPSPMATAAVPPPVSLAIPAIGVSTKLIHLGLTKTGALQVPSTTAVAGWYTFSPPPGAIGSAVIAGHVDSYQGPGVFYRLRLLHPHDRIYVRQADGKLAIFQVSLVRLYPKSGFPTDAVYGPTPTPTLRLVTCGGTFDPQLGSYLSNVIVYATLTT